jgi:hypothetical protein
MTQPKPRRNVESGAQRRRVIAVGKKVNGRWQVRTSLWRYLAATALSAQ